MRNRTSLILFFLFVTVFPECISGKVVAGAGRFEQYLPFIQGKRVGMVVISLYLLGSEHLRLNHWRLSLLTVLLFIHFLLDTELHGYTDSFFLFRELRAIRS